MSDARYPLLGAEEHARLSPRDLASYQAKRRAFDREVEACREQIRAHGWLNVAPPDWPVVRFPVPAPCGSCRAAGHRIGDEACPNRHTSRRFQLQR